MVTYEQLIDELIAEIEAEMSKYTALLSEETFRELPPAVADYILSQAMWCEPLIYKLEKLKSEYARRNRNIN